jgi:hypothetical protein
MFVLSLWSGEKDADACQIAHIIVLSDNRENSKRLTKGQEVSYDGYGCAKVRCSFAHETPQLYCSFRCGLVKLSIIRKAEAAGRGD